MAADRLSNLLNHLKPGTSSGLASAMSKNPDDIVITYAIRTPLTKAVKGSFKDTGLDYILLELMKGVITKSKIDPAVVDDICVGNCGEPFIMNKLRAAMLAAGFPNTTAFHHVNRFCSSGLVATQDIANQITTGAIEVGLAIGAESMTTNSKSREVPEFHPDILAHPESVESLWPMLQTSEQVAKEFNITREKQDRFAAESYARAENAQRNNWYDDEILPITTKVKTPEGEKTITVTKDEGPRWGTTFESLSKIRPAAPQWGDRSTGGNSSQVTDGAAAILLMKRSTAQRLGQPIIAKFVGATVVGLAPRIMGIGPSLAIPKLFKMFNLTKDDIDVFEINEAFASMGVYCLEKLELDHAKVNVRGGAIALGHPLGATGARQIVTGLSELRRQNKRVLVTSMCVGGGQGLASLIIRED